MIESIPSNFYIVASPFFILALASLVSVLFPSGPKSSLAFYIFTLSALGASLAGVFWGFMPDNFWNGVFVSDNLSFLSQSLILSIAFVLVILFRESSLAERFFTRETVSLFLLTILGMMVMLTSTDLITLFVGLELSSIGIYVLVGYVLPNRSSMEGAMKYLILGSFASAFLLFGFGLLYASTGTMNLAELAQKTVFESDIWIKIGILFSLTGIGFKLALVPFHMWTPDVYESAPTGITALMASSVKIMILVLALRMTHGLPVYSEQWNPIILILSFLSMVGGNFLALIQTSLKRMLAYSSIAHSGYMAIALCALGGAKELPYQAIMFYLIGYTLTSLLAFGTLIWLEDKDRQNLHLADIRGLVKSHPWAAFSLSAAMLSFAGMPPTVGFLGKFFIFNAALQENLYYLVLAGVFGSIISFYYYLRVIVTMYMQEPIQNLEPLKPRQSWLTGFILAATCVSILALGTVLPEHVLNSLKASAKDFIQD